MNEKVKAFGKLPQILTFPFKGEGWFMKLTIAALISLAGIVIPILPSIILLGYFYEMVRRMVVDHEDATLPEWDDWGGYIKNGFQWFLSTLIITVPFILIFIVTMALYFVPLFAMENGSGYYGYDSLLGGYFAFLFIAQFIMIFVSVIFMVFMGVFAPVYMTHIAAEGDLKAMFQIKTWWKVFVKGFWEFLISFILLYGVAFILYYIVIILMYSVVCCCLTPFIGAYAGVYLIAVYMALVASAYSEGRSKVPAEEKPLPLDDGSASDKVEEEVESLPEPEPQIAEDSTMIEEVEEQAPVEEEFELPSPDFEESVDTSHEDATVVGEVNAEVANAISSFDAATVRMDDLKKISGIGAKTAAALNQAGIVSYSQLADISVDKLKQILTDADLAILAATCDDWPQKAKDML